MLIYYSPNILKEKEINYSEMQSLYACVDCSYKKMTASRMIMLSFVHAVKGESIVIKLIRRN